MPTFKLYSVECGAKSALSALCCCINQLHYCTLMTAGLLYLISSISPVYTGTGAASSALAGCFLFTNMLWFKKELMSCMLTLITADLSLLRITVWLLISLFKHKMIFSYSAVTVSFRVSIGDI